MVKLMLRLLIVIFLLESTWAVAAQYCSHELGLDVAYFNHHQPEPKVGNSPTLYAHALIKADTQNGSQVDNDCPYCHLGAMKFIPTLQIQSITLPNLLLPTEVILIYPLISPHQPERPNWRLAA
jgi:hypothetical protein